MRRSLILLALLPLAGCVYPAERDAYDDRLYGGAYYDDARYFDYDVRSHEYASDPYYYPVGWPYYYGYGGDHWHPWHGHHDDHHDADDGHHHDVPSPARDDAIDRAVPDRPAKINIGRNDDGGRGALASPSRGGGPHGVHR